MIFENDTVFSLIKTLLVTFCTLGMMCSLVEFKYSLRKTIAVIGVYLLWVAVSSFAIIARFGYMAFLNVFIVTISAPAVVVVYRLVRNTPAQAVFNYVTQIAFSLCLEVSVFVI